MPTIQPSVVTPFYWIRFYFEDDETGMLRQMAEQMKRWDKQEDFVRDWNLKDHGIHPKRVATIDEKISYLKRNAFRYVDRRFTQYLKKKKSRNMGLSSATQISEAINPQSELEFAPFLKIKMSLKTLQGKASLNLLNPYFLWWIDIYARGDMEMNMQRNITFFDTLDFNLEMNYSYQKNYWLAALNKQLTQHLSTRLSSTQLFREGFLSKESERRIEFIYSRYY